MNNMDFSWIIKDINDSLIIKAFYEEKSISFDVCNYSAKEILSTTGDELVVEESNVSDISNFLNMGIVRFGNSNGGIMDIPLKVFRCKKFMIFIHLLFLMCLVIC